MARTNEEIMAAIADLHAIRKQRIDYRVSRANVIMGQIEDLQLEGNDDPYTNEELGKLDRELRSIRNTLYWVLNAREEGDKLLPYLMDNDCYLMDNDC